MKRHTTEPWRLNRDYWKDTGKYEISGEGWGAFAEVIVKMDGDEERIEEGVANAERIVAAINHCEGISTEDLLKHKHPMIDLDLISMQNPSKVPYPEIVGDLILAIENLIEDSSEDNLKNALYAVHLARKAIK